MKELDFLKLRIIFISNSFQNTKFSTIITYYFMGQSMKKLPFEDPEHKELSLSDVVEQFDFSEIKGNIILLFFNNMYFDY